MDEFWFLSLNKRIWKESASVTDIQIATEIFSKRQNKIFFIFTVNRRLKRQWKRFRLDTRKTFVM